MQEQVTEVVMVLDNVDTIQEIMEVDTEKEDADEPVWGMWRQDDPISDKSNSESAYWANEVSL